MRSRTTLPPIQRAARTANVWGWSYIVTILGAFGAGYVEAGPLRVLLLNFGILCFAIGVGELVLRHKLLQSGDGIWARRLAYNQIGGTLALLWSLYLCYEVPEQIFVDYSKKSDLWNRVLPLIKNMDASHVITDQYILQTWHATKIIGVFGVGGMLLLSQIWVVFHYLVIARKIRAAPAASPNIPPLLK